MVDLPFREKFESLPEIDPQQFVDYFNLEFGISADDPSQSPFTAADFKYVGVRVIDGIETMCWAVEGKNLFATVKPYENTYMIGVDSVPGALVDS